MKIASRTLSILFLLVVSTSCIVPNTAYRRSQAIVPRVASADPSQPQYDLAYLEFDDMGEFWTIGDLDRFQTAPATSQLSQALELISRRKQTSDVVVITFIHGWHNNASKYDESNHDQNLSGFKNILQQLATRDRERSYIGVFIGWRGEVVKRDPFVTYWNRRHAATR